MQILRNISKNRLEKCRTQLEEIDEQRKQMPSDAPRSGTGHHSEPTVVAESVEPEDALPEPTHIQSYGRGFQLR